MKPYLGWPNKTPWKQTISNYCTHKTCKKVYPILTLFKNLSILICITYYLWDILLGRSILFQTTKVIQHKKRCIWILFSESYSFDHPEYYAICCRTKSYQEHVALKNYALEQTKPLFNKHNLLTLDNLYASRSLVELIKILKLHSRYPRGGSWELAGNCVGCPIDGLGGGPLPQLPMAIRRWLHTIPQQKVDKLIKLF